MTNDNKRSYTITFEDAVNVWLLYWGGAIQSRIAASFDVNQGRINEVLKEKKHIGSKLVAATHFKAA